jgi:Ser/Thr protein kinase RdoA (MazF antagonist)
MGALAQRVIGAWGLGGATTRLIAHRWNTTFRVLGSDGGRYLLRIHHPGQQSVASVNSGLLWQAALRRDAGLSVPEPVEAVSGSLVVTAGLEGETDKRLCTLLRWIDGRFLYRGLTPVHLRRVGVLIAAMQAHAESWPLPAGFTRHRVDNLDPMQRDRDNRFDPHTAAILVRSVAEAVTERHASTLGRAVERVQSTLRAMDESSDAVGLIHADVHHRNLLFVRGVPSAIDFDDCGFGPWMYDLAVPLTQFERLARCQALREALLEGYGERRSIGTAQLRQLDTAIAIRRIQDVAGLVEERSNPAFRDRWRGIVEDQIGRLESFVES